MGRRFDAVLEWPLLVTKGGVFMSELASRRCVACRRDSPPVTDAEVAELGPQAPEWDLVAEDGIRKLDRAFRFRDFAQALDFTRAVGEAADSQGHHPRLVTEWGRVGGDLVDAQDSGFARQRLHHGGQNRRHIPGDGRRVRAGEDGMRVIYRLHSKGLNAVASEAAWAESMGYDGVSASETSNDPFIPLVLAATGTSRVTLETRVAIAFPRSPMVTAHMSRDIQDLSKGRFRLGLGTQVKGHIERRFSTNWASPGPRLREYVESLRHIWDCWDNGTRLDYRGKHYQFSLMTPFFNPGPSAYARRRRCSPARSTATTAASPARCATA